MPDLPVRRRRLLLFGARGQVGWELVRALSPLGDVLALDRGALDLTSLEEVRATTREVGADVIVNAAAYTHVDRAEDEAALAHRVNAEAPAVIAEEAARCGALFVHFSTDYVFDGKETRPLRENDPTRPQTAYGSSKLAGDLAVLESAAETYVFRVGWVYGRRGSNFLRTIDGLARQRDELRIVADQHGSPTWSRVIAEAASLAVGQCLRLRRAGLDTPARGVYHVASPDHTTWHGFAEEIVSTMPAEAGWKRPAVLAVGSAEFPTRAARPEWSVLDSGRLLSAFGLSLPPWREQLRLCMESGSAE